MPLVSVLVISVLNSVKRSKRDGLVKKKPLILPLADLRQMIIARDTVWMVNTPYSQMADTREKTGA